MPFDCKFNIHSLRISLALLLSLSTSLSHTLAPYLKLTLSHTCTRTHTHTHAYRPIDSLALCSFRLHLEQVHYCFKIGAIKTIV